MAKWGVIGIDENEFLANAVLLAIHEPCQYVKEQPGDDGNDPTQSSWNEELDKGDASMVSETTASDDIGIDNVIPKTLDRIAELFAKQNTSRDKSRQQRRTEVLHTTQDADDVTAAGFLRGPGGTQAKIILAKNGGFDENDEKMAEYLQKWLRVVALTVKCPPIKADRLWKQMVDFYQGQLHYYIEELSKLREEEIVSAYGEDNKLVKELRNRCVSYLESGTTDKAFENLHEIICLAYELRYSEQSTPTAGKSQRTRNIVNLLGRLRSAYESFKGLATGLPDSRDICGSIDIFPVPAPEPTTQSKPKICKSIVNLASQYNLPRPTQGQLNETLGSSKSISNSHWHAEMQVLMHLESAIESRLSPYPYLGCSEKSCWLCSQVIERYTSKGSRDTGPGFYRSRGSHDYVHPRWTLHVPPDQIIQFYLSSTVVDILDSMKSKLSPSAFVHQDPTAQSSADVTVLRGRVAQQELARRHSRESQSGSPMEDEVQMKLLFTRQCLCLSANGTEPSLVGIDFFERPKGYSGPEQAAGLFNWTVPDFSDSWGEFNLERKSLNVNVENQATKSLEGTYLLYCCENDALGENQSIKRILSLDVVDIEREFWYGDVFLVKYHEDPVTFIITVENVPVAILESDLVHTIIADLWSRDSLGDDSIFWSKEELFIKKLEYDKRILKSRMSPSEMKVLEMMPPNTLELLALTAFLTACDDGALISTSAKKGPNDPTKARISAIQGKTAAEELGDGMDSLKINSKPGLEVVPESLKNELVQFVAKSLVTPTIIRREN
ncbi:hypothetical protein F4821DRAFT_63503 [Hypoxylon rubiginosum]|uniref:Uncharacterized protein n=1 Tax=Hypoxylon rubiginosum TaxID=110542 RepID=A0ACC0CJ15_9PEZI|nr:hypothetical protein F4821DRAFT_63503 [Hypoxylon rubiginosum]